VATERRDSYCGAAQVPDTCARTSPLAMNVELGRLAGSLFLKAAT
jgi:hypothetical protein